MHLEPAGAEALLIVLGEQPGAQLSARIAQLAEQLRAELGPWLYDLVPSWTSLLLHYDLRLCGYEQLAARLTPFLEQWLTQTQEPVPGRLHELPVWYAGMDLPEVARRCQLTVAEVIERHSAAEYRVGALGFAPGFAYLEGLDERLALPRRATARLRVPAGSLAMAERQSAIYPQASPGGWHLLGLCPQPLFDAQAALPCPLQVGDRVRFVAIDQVQYQHLVNEHSSG